MRAKIFWLDEEENAAYPEMIQLKFHEIDVDYMTDADEALDRLIDENFDGDAFSAFVFDAHMPTFGDPRFAQSQAIHQSLAGVRLCEILSQSHSEFWSKISPRVLIYTMLPASRRVDAVRSFARTQKIEFVHKSEDGQVFEMLMRKNLLGQPEQDNG